MSDIYAQFKDGEPLSDWGYIKVWARELRPDEVLAGYEVRVVGQVWEGKITTEREYIERQITPPHRESECVIHD